jgi:tetratricopeptide repeat protein
MLRSFSRIVNLVITENGRTMIYLWTIGVLATLSAAAPARASAGGAADVRRIPVTLVTDSFFRQMPNWRGLAEGALTRATEDLEKDAGLRFTVEGEATWEVPDSAGSMDAMLRSAMTAVPPGPGILAILIGPREDNVPGAELGYAFLGKPALLVVAFNADGHDEKKELALVMRHELGHVFGIPHLQGRSVMNPIPDSRAWDFGELGLDVLRANRHMDFTSENPFSACDLGMLRDVYVLLDQRGEMEATLLLDLARAFELRGDLSSSEPLYEAALHRDRWSASARIGIAHCAMATQDTTKARVLAHALASMDLSPRQQSALGELWIRLHDFAAAESTLTRAVAKEPIPEAWFNLGLARSELRDRAGAAAAFRRYIEVDPEGARREDAERHLEAAASH